MIERHPTGRPIVAVLIIFARHRDKCARNQIRPEKFVREKCRCASGEPIRDGKFVFEQVRPPRLRRLGARKFFPLTGVTELANSLCECGVGAGGHLHDEQLHLENSRRLRKHFCRDGEVG